MYRQNDTLQQKKEKEQHTHRETKRTNKSIHIGQNARVDVQFMRYLRLKESNTSNER